MKSKSVAGILMLWMMFLASSSKVSHHRPTTSSPSLGVFFLIGMASVPPIRKLKRLSRRDYTIEGQLGDEHSPEHAREPGAQAQSK